VVLEQDALAQLTPLATALLFDPARLAAHRAALARLDAAPALDFLLADLDTLVAPRPVTAARAAVAA
jgi:hypothetical protein